MGIYYGDLPVGGGSGKAEWDKIEGKPFDTNTLINTTVVSTDLITLSSHQISGQKFGVLLNGDNYDIFEPKLVNNMYSVEFNGSTYNFESVSECSGRDGEYILKYNYLGNPIIMQEFGLSLINTPIGTDNNMPFCVIEEASYNEDRNNKLTGLMLYIVVADDAMEEASVGINMVLQQFGKLYQECLPEHTHDYAASEHTHFKLLFNFVDDDTFHIRTNITNKSCYVLATSSAGDSVKKDIMHVFYVNSGIGNASGKQWNIQAYTDSDCTIKIGDPVSFTMPPKITVSTTDLEDGVSDLPAGTLYFVYEE